VIFNIGQELVSNLVQTYAQNPALSGARLGISQAVLRVLKDALNLICVPFLEAM